MSDGLPPERHQELSAAGAAAGLGCSIVATIVVFIAGGVAIADGVVYQVSTLEEALGESPLSALYALDAATGEVLLRHERAGRAMSSPVVSRGRVYHSFGNSAIEEIGVDLEGGIECLAPRPTPVFQQ